ncbi:MAG: histidine kinase, partial [Acetobacteraceae bacterium]
MELTDPSGTQLLNLLRPVDAALGRTADQQSLETVVRTGRAVVGGIGPVGPVSGRRLVTLRVPVIRDSTLLAVLSAALAPDGIDTLLRRAGAPESWIGVVVDASGRIVARTQAVVGNAEADPLASVALRGAIATAPDGRLRGRTLDGIAVETVYRTLAGSDGWVVAFGIPVDLLEAPVRRALLLLAAEGTVGLLLAALLVWLVAHELAQRRANEAELAGRSLRVVEEGRALAVEAAELGVWRWRVATSVLDASPRCWMLLGLDPAGDNRAWRDAVAAIHPVDRATLLGAVRRSLKDGGKLDVALRIGDAEPPARWIRVTGRSVEALGKEDKVLQGVLADISQSRRHEAERRDLLRVMVQRQEEERRRISRELHDQVGQTVTGLSLGLKTLEETLVGSDSAVGERLGWLRRLAAGIGQDIHRAAADLRPAALD